MARIVERVDLRTGGFDELILDAGLFILQPLSSKRWLLCRSDKRLLYLGRLFLEQRLENDHRLDQVQSANPRVSSRSSSLGVRLLTQHCQSTRTLERTSGSLPGEYRSRSRLRWGRTSFGGKLQIGAAIGVRVLDAAECGVGRVS